MNGVINYLCEMKVEENVVCGKKLGSVFQNCDVVTERGKMCPVEKGTGGYAPIFKCSEKQMWGRRVGWNVAGVENG